MKNKFRAVIALILVMSMVLGIAPTDWIGEWRSTAQAAPATGNVSTPGIFDNLLDEAGELKTKGQILRSGDWQYVVLPDSGYAVITGYTGEGLSSMTVPDVLDGADTVGILSDALNGLNNVREIEIPGNVLAMGKDALPAYCTVRSTSGSYAQTWAKKNKHAFSTTSTYQFMSGVVDMTGVRTENFVRVSEKEVRLRTLEALRLQEGSVFFLVDPANAYQISYYRVTSKKEGDNGFVTFHCETPDINDVLYKYESKDETLMIDLSSVKLYEGATLNSPRNRSMHWNVSTSLNMGLDTTIPIGDLKLNITGMMVNTYKADIEVGFGVKNKVKIEENQKAEFSVALSTKLNKKEDDKGKSFGDLMDDKMEKVHKAFKTKADTLEAPMGSAVILSVGGIVNLAVSLKYVFEYTGEIRITFTSSSVTTYTYRDGEGVTKTSTPGEKKLEGSVQGKLKTGVELEVGLYIAVAKVMSASLFIGLKAEAKFDLDTSELAFVKFNALNQFVTDKNLNLNMIDCVIIKVSCIVEFAASIGFTDNLTLASIRATLADIPLVTLHWHLLLNPITQNANKDDNGEVTSYTYTIEIDKVKNFLHYEQDCPYKTYNVNFILPYKNNLQLRSLKNLNPGTEVDKPEFNMMENYGRKLISWHTNSSMDKASKVNDDEWPYTIKKDTTFFAKTVPVHDLWLVDANGKGIEKNNRAVQDTSPATRDVDFKGGHALIAEGEYFDLPSKTASGDSIALWIPVYHKWDLRQVDDEAVLNPGDRYVVTAEARDEIVWCALTDHDIEARFYNDLGQYERVLVSRGQPITMPEGPQDMYLYHFVGWEDVEGNLIEDPTYPTDENTKNLLVFRQRLELSDFSGVIPLERIAIGCEIPEPGSPHQYNSMLRLSYDEKAFTASVSGFEENPTEHPQIDLDIPDSVTRDGFTYSVTAIDAGAFNDKDTLRTIHLPASIKTVGEGAFNGCNNLLLIDMSLCHVTDIPKMFAYGCDKLQSVVYRTNLTVPIGEKAFMGCKALTAARIAGDIGVSAFENCTGLSTIILENRIWSIGSYAFKGCTGLTSLAIPGSVNELGSNIIDGCTNLTTLEINALIYTLSADVFKIGNGSKLNTLILGGGVRNLSSGCFSNSGNGFEELENIIISGTPTINSDVFSGSAVRNLTLNGGIVGYGAFRELPYLETVVIGDAVLSIGGNAFSSCPMLREVTIGENVISIGDQAFRNCTALETITFNTLNLKSLGGSVFENCSSLTSLEIPETVTTYWNYLIRGCTGLQTLSVGSGISNITSALVFYIGFQDLSLKTIIVREGVTSIPDYTFSNGHSSGSNATGYYSLEEVILPSTLRSIGKEAFWKAGMKKLTVGSAVSLSSSAFAYCDRLEELVYNAGSIADYAFQNCTALKKVTIGDAVSSIGKYAFSECSGLQTITIGNGVSTIGDDAFKNCTGLTTLTIPDQVQSAGLNILSGCINLTTLSVGSVISSMSNFYIGSNSNLTTVILREGVTSLGANAFRNGDYGFQHLANVSFPSTLMSIGTNAFKGTKLTEVTLHSDVEIGDGAFEQCDQLQSVSMQGGAISSSAFEKCTALTSFTMGDVTRIGLYAFQGCTALKSLTIPDTVEAFADSALRGCTGLEYLSIGAVGDDAHFGPELRYTGTSHLKTLVLREGVKTIRDYEFNDMPYLAEVSFPDTLETIGKYAFKNSAIRKADITGNTMIKEGAFQDCRRLTEVTIGCGSIGSYAFQNCSSLKTFILRIGSGEIGTRALNNCTALETVLIGDGVTAVREHAFENCRALTTLALPDTVTAYESFMIQGCTGLKQLSVGSGFTGSSANYLASGTSYPYSSAPSSIFYIGPSASLEQVTFGEGVTLISSGLLSNVDPDTGTIHGFPTLRSVTLPDSLAKIGQAAFYGSEITEIRLRGNVEITENAFAGMQKLKRFSMRAGKIGKRAFMDDQALASVTLGEGVTDIGEEAFMNCTALRSLYVPDSVTGYGRHMIFGCTGLRNLSLGAGAEGPTVNQCFAFMIGEGSMLEWLEVREGITTLWSGALANGSGDVYSNDTYGYSHLHTLCLPASVVGMGYDILNHLPALRHLYLKNPQTLFASTEEYYGHPDRVGLPAGVTIYMEAYDAEVAEYCAEYHLNYVVRGEEEYPSWQLTLAVPTGKAAANGGNLDRSFAIFSRSMVEYATALNLADPVPVNGYSFFGWYTDPDFTCEWNGTDMPARELTLYARIEKNTDITFAVNIPAAGTPDSSLPAGFYTYRTYSLKAGDPFPMPDEPLAEYYSFAGWYTEPTMTVPCRMAAVPEKDTVIYGRMERISAGGEYARVPGGLKLTRYVLQEGESLHLEIPARINGSPVVSIGEGAFENCSAHSIRIPETVTEIAEGAFRSDHAFMIRVAKENPQYVMDKGILYDKDKTILIYCAADAVIDYYTRLPSTLRRVAAYAFYGDTSLYDLPLPDGLEEIGAYAFAGCSGLTYVTLPVSVTTMGRNAFKGCYKLESFTARGLTNVEYREGDIFFETLPDNGILRVYGPVGDCALRQACLFRDSNGNAYNLQYNLYSLTAIINGTTESMRCEAGQKLDQLLSETVLQDGTVIYGWFRNSGLTDPWNLDTDVMPANSLTLYASSAPPFTYRTGEVTDENGTTRSGAILTLWNGAAAMLTIPNSIGSYTVVGLDSGFLSKATGLSRLQIPTSVVYIDENALVCADGDFSGTIIAEPDSYAARWAEEHQLTGEETEHILTLVSDNEPYRIINATQGTPVFLPVLEDSSRTFTGWSTSASYMHAPELDNDVYLMPGQDVTLYAFWENAGDSTFTWTVRNGKLTVTGYTGSSTVISIPEEINGSPVTAIGDRAFENMTGLSRVILPDSLTDIGAYAFNNCTNLKECALPSGLKRIGDYAMARTCLPAITVPDSVTDLGKGAFSGCESLYELHLGLNTPLLTADDLEGDNRLHAITVTAGSDYLKAEDGVLFSADGTVLRYYPLNRGETSYTVPDGTYQIAAQAFRRNPDLETVTLPSSVTMIGKDAFAGCPRLTRFTAGGLMEIGDRAFFGCPLLAEVSPGSRLCSLGSFAFVSNPSLHALTLPSTLVIDPEIMCFDDDTGLQLTGVAGSSAQAYARAWGIAFTDPNAAGITSITLSSTEITIERGTAAVLTATIQPAGADGAGLAWSSSDPEIIRVEDGKIYALKNGTAKVYASGDNGVSASCSVTVTTTIQSIRINLIPALGIGETVQMSVTTDPNAADQAGLTWTSSHPAVATINETGFLTAAGTGTTTVTVTTANGKTDSIPVTVYQPVTGVSISAPSDRMYAIPGNNTLQLTANVQPANATFPNVHWSSSDRRIATVDQNGLVTAAKAGSVTITAVSDDPDAPTAEYVLTVELYDISSGNFGPNQSAVYTGKTAVVPSISVDGNIISKDYFTVSNTSFRDAGEYEITVTGKTGWTTGQFTGTFTITPATPTITFHVPETVYEYTLYSTYDICDVDIYDQSPELTCRRVLEDGSLGPEGEPTANGIFEVTVTVPGTNNIIETSASTRIKVYVADEITVEPAMTLPVGITGKLPVSCFDYDDGYPYYASPQVRFESSDASIVSITADGVLTTHSAGTAIVTVIETNGTNATAECVITVRNEAQVLSLPAALREIGEEAFMGDAAVRYIRVNSGTRKISPKAFANMSGLAYVDMPASVRSIADNAFAGSRPVLLCPAGSSAEVFAVANGFQYLIK